MVYTPEQVAEQLNVHRQSIQKLCRSGALRAVNLSAGKQRATWRITEESLDEFLNPQRDAKPAKKATRQARIDRDVPQVYK